MRFYYSLILVVSIFHLGCDSNPFVAPPVNCESEQNCPQGSAASSLSSQSNRNPSSTGSNPVTISPTAIGVATPSSSGSTSNSGSSSTGSLATATGSSSSGTSSGSSSDVQGPSYALPGGDHYFGKLNEPVDQQIYETYPLVLKFVAAGRPPLKYLWYREKNGQIQKLASEGEIFEIENAKLSDSAIYFATVEDSEGHKLTSRKAQVYVHPERKTCRSGEYGPHQFNSQTQKYDYSKLVPLSEMPRTQGAQTISLPGEIDGYALASGYCITPNEIQGPCAKKDSLIQCQNGVFSVLF